jgi:hypothetical protein
VAKDRDELLSLADRQPLPDPVEENATGIFHRDPQSLVDDGFSLDPELPMVAQEAQQCFRHLDDVELTPRFEIGNERLKRVLHRRGPTTQRPRCPAGEGALHQRRT